jgi:hypothetical protein
MENKYLGGMSVSVTGEDTHFIVKYSDGESTGECIYEVITLKGNNKPISQTVYIMVSSEMGEIISTINDCHPLSESDMTSLSMEIRNDSLRNLTYHLEGGSAVGSPQ